MTKSSSKTDLFLIPDNFIDIANMRSFSSSVAHNFWCQTKKQIILNVLINLKELFGIISEPSFSQFTLCHDAKLTNLFEDKKNCLGNGNQFSDETTLEVLVLLTLPI